MRRSGNGSRVEKVERAKAVTGPISTKLVSRATLPGCRRVTCHAACEASRWAGWARSSPKRSARNRKRSRKPRGSAMSSSSTSSQSRSLGGCASSSRLRFSNFPALGRRAQRSSTSWRERASSARIARASAACSGRSTHSASTRRVGRRMARGAGEAQAAAAGELERVQRQRRARRGAGRRGRRRCRSRRRGSRRACAGRAAGGPRRRGRACGIAPFAQASRRRPVLWATIVRPAGQRRRERRGRRSRRACAARARATGARRARRRSAAPPCRARRRPRTAGAGARRPARGDDRARRATYSVRVPRVGPRSRSCHSCSSPPCSSETSNGPTRCKRARGGSPCWRPTRSARGCHRAPRSSVVIGGASRPQLRGAAALQARADRAGEDVHVGVLARGGEQRREPAGARPRRRRPRTPRARRRSARRRCCAPTFRPSGPRVGLVAGAEALGEPARRPPRAPASSTTTSSAPPRAACGAIEASATFR